MYNIDLRSDTVTLPSDAMRRAMASAEVGDDVMREDPTVNRLEALAAEMLGKEAGLFVWSGTMGNLTSVLAHCGRGDELIVGDNAHIFMYECGGCSVLGGVHSRQVPNLEDGTMEIEAIEAAIRARDNIHFPRSRLICLENTHNRRGGACLPAGYMRQVRAVADRHDVKIHLDGARIFNAAIALDVSVAELVQDADSVTFCLSKGLAAPMGSVVCGDAAFIQEARRARKLIGGAGRQVGIVAAAGVYALENMVARLADDHVNARRLANGLAEIPGLAIDPDRVQTNIVVFDVQPDSGFSPDTFCQRLDTLGVRVLPFGGNAVRAVTHYGISSSDIDQALVKIKNLMTT